MSFVYLKYLPLILAFICFYSFIQIKFERNFFDWVKTYWFYRRKWRVVLSTILKILGVSGLCLALMDYRGEEEKTKIQSSDQKTIILIDASASMLAEDIRPNRFKKALVLARHFIKQAYGHQVSVLVFSDTHKRLVPFTDDFDLLESRVAALEDLDLKDGGSNLSQAIFESLSYFSEVSPDVKTPQGNILVLTDSEENGDGVKINKDLSRVNLAIVGIGTAKGAPIPVRFKDGKFQGNKRHNGEEVISKLDEEQMKSFGKIFKNYKYWIALSYSIPTDEILTFFREKSSSGSEERDHVSRPVKMHYLVIPSLFLILLSILFRFGNVYKIATSLLPSLIPLLIFTSLQSQEIDEEAQKAKEQFWELHSEQFSMLENGKLPTDQTLKLGELALRAKIYDDARLLYRGAIGSELKNETAETLFNYTTSELANNKIIEAADLLEKLNEKLAANPEFSSEYKEKMRQNVLLAINKKLQKQAEEEKKKQEEEQKKKNGEQKEGGEGQGEKQDEKQDQNGKNQDQEKKDNKSEDDKQEEKNKEEEKMKEQQKKEQKSESQKEREERIKQQKKMVKIPSLLKQLMNEDRDLQKRNIDPRTSTTKWEKGKEGKKIDQDKKDW